MSGAARRYFRLAVPVFASVMFAYLIYALELNYERERAENDK